MLNKAAKAAAAIAAASTSSRNRDLDPDGCTCNFGLCIGFCLKPAIKVPPPKSPIGAVVFEATHAAWVGCANSTCGTGVYLHYSDSKLKVAATTKTTNYANTNQDCADGHHAFL